MKKILSIFLSSFVFIGAALSQDDARTITRVALLIGSNAGGADRPTLRWAEKDARSFSAVMRELGGLDPRNEHLLLSPDRRGLVEEFSRIRAKLTTLSATSGGSSARRNEFLFYYSGHSDDEGLFLGEEKVSYADLKSLIGGLDAQVNLVVLDSCSSGAITRLKGGTKAPPFLADESSSLSGHAYLTSSSEYEPTQESDKIQGSYFTYYLVAGLRGAADESGDKRVTLNEAYSHAFAETLSRTENTKAGPQHPSYNIKLSGSGDLVLTDLRSAENRLIFDRSVKGRLMIRDDKERLVAETLKAADADMEFSLPSGTYSITLIADAKVLKTRLSLSRGDAKRIGVSTMIPVKTESAVLRGEGASAEVVSAEDAAEPEVRMERFSLSIYSFGPEIDELRLGHNFALNLIGGKSYVIEGMQVGVGASWVTDDLKGIQAAAGFNYVGDDAWGAQFAAGANIVRGDFVGYQNACVDIVYGNVKGYQDGVINYAGSLFGVQSGVVNVSGESLGGAFGVINVSDDSTGVWAGVVNVSDDSEGLWVGVVNANDRFSGLQLGVVNYAREAHGVQLGVLNLAGSNDGYPIGVVSVVLRGGQTHLLSWMGSDGFACGAFVHGSRKVYNLYGGGYNAFSGKSMSLLGIGYSLELGKLYFNLEALGGTIYEEGNFGESSANHPAAPMGGLRLYGGYSFAEHFSLIAGAGYSWLSKIDYAPSGSDREDEASFDKAVPSFFIGIRL
jgi:hypothetical protein